MGPSLPASFLCLPATEDEVRSVISSFVTKVCNLDNIPVNIYTYLIPVLCPVITNLFNCSILEGIFLDCLKVGRVIPLHKADDTKSKGPNFFFHRFSGHNLREALFVYRLIGATLIGIFFMMIPS